MPILEFTCKEHGTIERVIIGGLKGLPECPKCKKTMELKEFSVPARRNPDKGIQT